MLFHLANLPYWIFLAIGVGLSLLVIFSGGDDEAVDLDVDGDVDIGSDIHLVPELDTTTHTDTDVDTDGSVLNPLQLLKWLGLGQTPLILLLAIDFSIWGFSGWLLNVVLANITGKMPTALFGLGGVVMLTSFIISLWIGGLISRPLGKIFAQFGEDVSSDRVIGCVGTVSSKTIPYQTEGKIGQVDVCDLVGNLVTINVCLPQWATVIPHRGEQVLILEKKEHNFIAIAKDSSDEDKWLNNSISN